jgi:hypothetical protein
MADEFIGQMDPNCLRVGFCQIAKVEQDVDFNKELYVTPVLA